MIIFPLTAEPIKMIISDASRFANYRDSRGENYAELYFPIRSGCAD